jgi:predicted RNase H-like HicB family nuclease
MELSGLIVEVFVGRMFMHNEFTAIIEQDGEWFIGYCPEIPGANGQGRTIEDCRENLAAAISLILEDRREDAFTPSATR